MKQIKLILKDEIYDSLERDYQNFVRLSTKIDRGFVSLPSIAICWPSFRKIPIS